jgi:hypothetical protein
VEPHTPRAVFARALSGASNDGDVRATFACFTPKEVLADLVPARMLHSQMVACFTLKWVCVSRPPPSVSLFLPSSRFLLLPLTLVPFPTSILFLLLPPICLFLLCV